LTNIPTSPTFHPIITLLSPAREQAEGGAGITGKSSDQVSKYAEKAIKKWRICLEDLDIYGDLIV
jgi:hypothetical protein